MSRETNWLDKSDTNVFVNFTRKLKVGPQWIYFYPILGATPCLMLSIFY